MTTRTRGAKRPSLSLRTALAFSFFAALSAAAVGCSNDDSAPQPAPQSAAKAEQAAVCAMNFEATVLEGSPSAGTKISGVLTLIEADPGRLAVGHLLTADGALLPARASLSASTIALGIELPDGQFVQGTGPMQGSLGECKQEMIGVGIGPKIGAKEDGSDSDRLHWLAASVVGTYVVADQGALIALDPSGSTTQTAAKATLSGCISGRVGACVQKCGGNGSLTCGQTEVNKCKDSAANQGGEATVTGDVTC